MSVEEIAADASSGAHDTQYDRVGYRGHPLPQAHPDRLATIGALYGLQPPPIGTSRILEVGCGDGTNLIATAAALPESVCVGIDLAASGIRAGQSLAKALGLCNLSLRQADIADLGAQFGCFDYIIAHGVYSWIPASVRDKLMALCRDCLAPDGIAYISYNVHPGNLFREIARGMMRFHVQEMGDAEQRIAQSRALIKFLSENGADDPAFFRPVLQREYERLCEIPDSVLFHDDLSEVNEPVWFHQFAAHTQSHRLQYLGEAQFFENQSGNIAAKSMAVVDQIADGRIAKEQYLDFLKCRSFRQSLLVHEHRRLDFDLAGRDLSRFHVTAPTRLAPTDSANEKSGRVTILGPQKSSLTTDSPGVQRVFAALGESWPVPVAFPRLLEIANDAGTTLSAADLASTLMRTYAAGMIELSLHPPRMTRTPGTHPMAGALARLLAGEDGDVINLRHHRVHIDDFLGRGLLQLMDGSRDRDALVRDLKALVRDHLAADPQATAAQREQLEDSIERNLDHNLSSLAGMALVIQ